MPKKDPPPRRPGTAKPRTPLLLRPVQWVKRFFTRDVRLQRRGRGFSLVFAETQIAGAAQVPVAPAAPACVSTAAAPTSAMHDDLRHLLAQHTQARKLMRHLAFVERALRLSGSAGLEGLPPEVMKTALQQLEGVVTNWSAPGLAELRSRLAVLAMAHEEIASGEFQPTNSNLSDFDTPQRIEVSEATPSDFEELERIWGQHAPGAVEPDDKR